MVGHAPKFLIFHPNGHLTQTLRSDPHTRRPACLSATATPPVAKPLQENDKTPCGACFRSADAQSHGGDVLTRIRSEKSASLVTITKRLSFANDHSSLSVGFAPRSRAWLTGRESWKPAHPEDAHPTGTRSREFGDLEVIAHETGCPLHASQHLLARKARIRFKNLVH